MDHVRELRGRLFWTAVWFVVVTGAVFPFFNDVIKLLMRPLGNEQLYYLSPVGGLSFAMKICVYVGIIATLPVLIYHMYKFIAPIFPHHKARSAALYMLLSGTLACTGVIFAYTVSLPSALHFLTNFDINGVSAMLTVDAYLSFIVSYLLAGAALFQLPLIMVIVDTITPTPPSQWNRFQRHMVVAAFVIAMLITPSPDIINQVIMAIPVVFMYQFGIFLIWFRHRRSTKAAAGQPVATEALLDVPVTLFSEPLAVADAPEPQIVAAPPVVAAHVTSRPTMSAAVRSIDGVRRPSRAPQPHIAVPSRHTPQAAPWHPPHPQLRAVDTTSRQTPRVGISMDGFLPAR